MDSNPTILIGCASWSISSAYAIDSEVPRLGSHLERYSAVLSAVEINTSFYRSHRPATYVRWRETTPASFRFSVKVPRSITHEKKLIGVEDVLDRFIYEVEHLEEKLGCLLLQLPPKLKFELHDAAYFFDLLRSKTAVKIVCEPRHISWFDKSANELFEAHNITRVLADPPIAGVEHAPSPRSGTTYLRLHGIPEIYRSAYSETYLNELAVEMARQADAGMQTWCVFDNTASGAAFGNALYLQRKTSRHFQDNR